LPDSDDYFGWQDKPQASTDHQQQIRKNAAAAPVEIRQPEFAAPGRGIMAQKIRFTSFSCDNNIVTMPNDARFLTVVLLICAAALFLTPKRQPNRNCGGPIDHLFGDCIR
jgi:hypothetical protein